MERLPIPRTARVKPRAALSAAPGPAKPRASISFLDAMDSPALFKPWFSGESWTSWRIAGKALFGLPMTPEEFEVYRRHTGRRTAPTAPTSEAWLAIGRRGGKGWFSAAVAVYLACLQQHHLKRGELGRVMVLAADRDQAGETFRYISELIDSIPVLSQLVVSRTKESIDLNNKIQITVQTGSFRRVRGRKIVSAICDEIAFWYNDETSSNPDHEILAAIRPSMMSVTGAMLICISSPYARRGALWVAYRDHFGKDGDDVLVWQASTIAMNPLADRKFLDREYQKDPVSFRAEYEANFRTDLESYISPEAVEAVVVKGRTSLQHEPHQPHYAFMDPAGGSGGDSLTLAIARRDEDRSVIVRVAEWRPQFDPIEAAKELAAILREYGLSRVRGDRFSGGTWKAIVRERGIAYEYEEKTKSDIYHDFLPLLNARRVELLDQQRTINQLLALERSTSKLGKDTIGHPRGGWDDLINATAGAALMAQRPKMLEGWTPYKSEPKSQPEQQQGSVTTETITRYYGNCCHCGNQHLVNKLGDEPECPQLGWSFGPAGMRYPSSRRTIR